MNRNITAVLVGPVDPVPVRSDTLGMKGLLLILILALATLVGTPATASADLTAFFGLSPKPEMRTAKGVSFGVALIVVGFELEYSDIAEKPAEAAPRVRTGMANVFVQTPTPGAQLYATAGAGVFREELADRRETNTGINVGGGIKMGLVGPIRLRVDYRLFTLRGDPLYKTVHRVYAGVNASF